MAGPAPAAMRGLPVLFALLVAATLARAQPGDEVHLTFLPLNDLTRIDDAGGRGGFARLATAVSDEQRPGRHVFVVHAGGALSPSPISALDRGEHMMGLLAFLGVDLLSPGGPDFNFGLASLTDNAARHGVPLVLSNVRLADGTPLRGIETGIVRQAGGFRIGFIGLLSTETLRTHRTVGLHIDPPVRAGELAAERLRGAGADFVVALGFLADAERDALLASGAVDLVLTSWADALRFAHRDNAVAAQSQPQGGRLVAIDVTLRRRVVEAPPQFPDNPDSIGDAEIDLGPGDLRSEVIWTADPRIVDTVDLPIDYLMLARVQQVMNAHSVRTGTALGTLMSAVDTTRTAVRTGRSTFGNLVADAMLEALPADVALVNAGNIQGDSVHQAGTVLRRRQLLRELPFGNRVVLLRVPGRVLLEALENGVSRVEERDGRLPYLAGMIATYDPSAPAGARISNVRIQGAAIDLDRSYLLATTDFIAAGRDGYAMLAAAPRAVDERSALMLIEVMANHLRGGALERPFDDQRLRGP